MPSGLLKVNRNAVAFHQYTHDILIANTVDIAGIREEYVQKYIDIMDHQVFNNRTSRYPCRCGIMPFKLHIEGFITIFLISATIGLNRSICPTPIVIPSGAFFISCFASSDCGTDRFFYKNGFFPGKYLPDN